VGGGGMREKIIKNRYEKQKEVSSWILEKLQKHPEILVTACIP
jgi:hypothetical protein